jgi:hypothetical protein
MIYGDLYTVTMKKIFFIIAAVLLAQGTLMAEGKISGGITAGYQHDTGNLSEKGGVNADVEQNLSAGAVFKLDMGFLFFRSGCEYSHPVEKGRFYNRYTGGMVETALSFYEVPVYAGLNLPVRGYGFFYLGGGGSYIFGTGYVETDRKNDISEQLFGYGFLAGGESEIYNDASFIFEWEYMSASSSPVASVSGVYDDYCIDYTGNRFRIGIIYHFNRYQ